MKTPQVRILQFPLKAVETNGCPTAQIALHVCDIENADADNYNELEQVILKKDLKNFYFLNLFSCCACLTL